MSDNWESLIVDEIKKELVLLSKQKGLTNPIISFSSGSAIGDNYLGDIVNVIIEGGNKNLNIIVKCAPRTRGFREKAAIRELYLREMYVYDILFREFLKIQKDCNISEVFNPFALCYKTIKTEGFETLIMENMKSIGYYMEDRTKPLSNDHVFLIIRSYAKLHALSFALREHEPAKFRTLANNLKERFFSLIEIPDDYYIQITKEVSDLLEEPLKGKFDYYRSKIETILREELCEETPGRYAVIGHGDCWTNNFLFKNEDFGTSKKPTSVIFLDWQLCRMSSPFADLFYFLFVCTDKKFRDEHFYNLMDEYYKSFSSFLSKLGCDPGQAFPREVFDEHMKRFMGFGLYMAVAVLKPILSEKEQVYDYKSMSEEDFKKNSDNPPVIKSTAEFEKRVTDVIADAQEYGCVYLR